MTQKFRMVGRAVECGGLENRCGGDSTGGSNPSPSASNKKTPLVGVFFYYRRMASGSNRNAVAPVRQQVDFGSANAPKSSRLPRRHNVPREYEDKQLVKSKKIAVHKIFLILIFGYQGTPHHPP